MLTSFVPCHQSRRWSQVALAADMALDSLRAWMTAAPLCCTVWTRNKHASSSQHAPSFQVYNCTTFSVLRHHNLLFWRPSAIRPKCQTWLEMHKKIKTKYKLKLETQTRRQCRVLDASTVITWPWRLTPKPDQIIFVQRHGTSMRKSGKNPSIDTGDIVDTCSFWRMEAHREPC